jgi:hypothetical protein
MTVCFNLGTMYPRYSRMLVEAAKFDCVPQTALCLVKGARDEHVALESVRRFAADLEPLYGVSRVL